MLNHIGLPGLLLIALVLVLPIAVALYAKKAGRSFFLWLFVSLLLTGVGGALLLMISEETKRLALKSPGRASA